MSERNLNSDISTVMVVRENNNSEKAEYDMKDGEFSNLHHHLITCVLVVVCFLLLK